MRYFRLHHDERENSGLIMYSGDTPGMAQAMRGDLSLPEGLTVLMAHSFKGKHFAELVDRQVFMYRNRIKEVFEAYLPSLEHKEFCVIDADDNKLHMYYSAPILRIVSVLAAKADGAQPQPSRRSVLLDKRALEDADMPDIFRLADPEKHIIVSSSVAESLLRREIPGIHLTHIDII
jgi:hypothetical protein